MDVDQDFSVVRGQYVRGPLLRGVVVPDVPQGSVRAGRLAARLATDHGRRSARRRRPRTPCGTGRRQPGPPRPRRCSPSAGGTAWARARRPPPSPGQGPAQQQQGNPQWQYQQGEQREQTNHRAFVCRLCNKSLRGYAEQVVQAGGSTVNCWALATALVRR